jgi:outer membrane lipoprotein-sorting protein
MKQTQDISQVIRQLHISASSELDERVRGEIAKAAASAPAAPSEPEPTFGQILALFMKKKATRYTFATTLGLALLVVLVLNHSITSAWAMDQAIEALKKYRGIHIAGYVKNRVSGETTSLDIWARSDITGNLVEIGLARAGNVTTWTKDNKTYTYDQAQKTVYVEPGINFFTPWFGPKLLARLAGLKDYQAVEGDDPATGQKRVVVTASTETYTGPQSFLMEFDARTKLPISIKQWRNLKREGAPLCSFEKIIYFENLPDSTFDFQPPAGTPFTDMPIWVPEANLSLLSNPKCGISAEGMTREQACRKILEQMWTAWIQNDLTRVHELFPLTATVPDELLHDLSRDDRVVEILKIGGIERTGSSKLGPLALVPTWVRHQSGADQEVWMIIQFRKTDQGTSCVIHGVHGYALNVKE